MKQNYLLIEDVEGWRSGEVVAIKPGFARNYLLPRGKAVLATPHTLRMQIKLKEERAKKALVDKKEAEEIAEKLKGITLQIFVKVDPEGHMYGSVNAADIIHLFEQEGVKLEPRHINLNRPIKQTGLHSLKLKLNEGVVCEYHLNIISEEQKTEKNS